MHVEFMYCPAYVSAPSRRFLAIQLVRVVSAGAAVSYTSIASGTSN